MFMPILFVYCYFRILPGLISYCDILSKDYFLFPESKFIINSSPFYMCRTGFKDHHAHLTIMFAQFFIYPCIPEFFS